VTVTVLLDSDDISGEVYQIDFNDGRSLETETFDVGSATILVRNRAANFNPVFLTDTSALLLESDDFILLETGDRLLLESGNGTGAGAYGDVDLGRAVTIKDGAVIVFSGFIEDIDFQYDHEGQAVAALKCKDALATLGAAYMQEWDPDQELTGARIIAVLDDEWVGYPAGATYRDIATGTQPLAASTIPFNTNALAYLQAVNRSENGRLFASRLGKLTFLDRYDQFNVTPSAAFTDDIYTPGDQNEETEHLPFSAVSVRYGTELLHFRVSVQRDQPVVDAPDEIYTPENPTINTIPAPMTRTVSNDALAAGYPNLGKRSLTISGVLFNSDHHSEGLAQIQLEHFTEFGAVISGLTVPMHRLNTADRATVAALDKGDVVTVTFTPTGTSGSVFQTLVIEGRDYHHDYTTETTLAFQLSDARDPGYFVVDTDAVGGTKIVAP
jgi:hypothetical protein